MPLVYLVMSLARIQAGSYAVTTAAREAGRAFVTAEAGRTPRRGPGPRRRSPSRDQGFGGTGSLEIACSTSPCLTPDARVETTARVTVPLPLIPAFARDVVPLEIPLTASHLSTVDRFRGAPVSAHRAGRRESALRDSGARRDEEGRVMLLILVFSMVCTLLITGVIAVTSVHLSRMKLLDVADGAALAAANALDDTAYQGGVGQAVPLSNATVQQAAADYVVETPDARGTMVVVGTRRWHRHTRRRARGGPDVVRRRGAVRRVAAR